MCGRYQIYDDTDEEEIWRIIMEINRREPEASFKPGIIYPTNTAPILTHWQGKQSVKLMRWGFPQWKGSGVVINARSETAKEKRMFSDSLRQRRAVIPTMGFFEWRHEGKAKKEMYLFREQGRKALFLAGFYNTFAMADGSREERFTILTTNANESMEPYHDRMPVLLDERERDAWLADPSATDDILHRVPKELTAASFNNNADQRPQAPQQMSLFS